MAKPKKNLTVRVDEDIVLLLKKRGLSITAIVTEALEAVARVSKCPTCGKAIK